jgi:DNA mismatch repair protein MutS
MTTTPMMAQFMEIKAANSDCLVFFRMGDFYELFFDDAEIASKVLNITLTKRGKHHGKDIPMAGVPVKAADDYLQKLIAEGFKVAVCEQLEDPREAKKRGSKAVVRRDVVRLITPGTLTEDNLLDGRRANWLLALKRLAPHHGENEGAVALAWADISTGQFHMDTVSDDRFASELSRIEPAEILLEEEDTSLDTILAPTDYPLARLDSGQFSKKIVHKLAERYFKVQALESLGHFTDGEWQAAAALLSYIDRTQAGSLPPLSRPQRDNTSKTMRIDAVTRQSLELLRDNAQGTKGSLLAALDQTMTSAGSRLLAQRLTSPLTDIDRVNHRLDGIAFFLDQPGLRADLRLILKNCPDMMRALSRLVLNRGGPRDLKVLQKALHCVHDLVGCFNTQTRAELLPELVEDIHTSLVKLPLDYLATLDSALEEDVPAQTQHGGFIVKGYARKLDEARHLRDDTRQIIAALEQDYREETGIKTLKIRHNNVLGYYVEVTLQHAKTMQDREIDKTQFFHRQSLVNNMRFSTKTLVELEEKIALAADEAHNLEVQFFEDMREGARQNADILHDLAEALAGLDVLCALAELAETHNYSRPVLNHSLDFDLKEGRHPVVESLLKNQHKSFIPNDCCLSGDQQDASAGLLTIVTGPNMGGKSTYLRQNAVIAIMAQAGCYVPATSLTMGVVDQIFSRVGASDDLSKGQSTFMVEMVETAAILNQATQKSLVILDEIGRGTSTYDGVSLAWACLEHLHNVNRCRGLFATHYHELTALAHNLERVANVHVQVKEWRDDVIFLHKIGKGAADRSYGIQVARLAGVPDGVLKRARTILHNLENRRNQGQFLASAPDPLALLEELPLFALSSTPETKPDQQEQENHILLQLHQELDELDTDSLTPKQALDMLYHFKNKIVRQPH